MKEKRNVLKNKNNKAYIIYTILFCVISIVVFAIFIKNNKGFIWQEDGFKQHYAILYDFNQMVRDMFSNGFSMLSWNMGLGLDVIGQYSYYVIGDPFAYISLLFPIKYLETIYSALIILRMYCVGLAFIAYCKYQGKSGINTIIGAIIYTFCGFVLYAGIRHPYFTNAAILLPLNLIGIEKLLRENKKSFLIFIIFISAISNYYFFYMITIINMTYAIVKYIFEYNKGIRDFFKKVFTAGLCYIIGILMASIILLPTIYAFLNSARTGCEQTSLYCSDFYQNLFMGLICMRFKNWTVISISSIVILMVPILLTKLKEKETKTYTSLLIITTLMLCIPFIASMMNGFSFPSNRWIFAYSFILSYIVTMCFQEKLRYSKKQMVFMGITLALYSLIGILVTKFKIKSNLDFYAAIVIAVLIWMIIVINNIKNKFISKINPILKYSNIIVICLITLNIFITSFALYSSRGKGYVKEFLNNNSVSYRYSNLNGKINNFKEAVEYIKQNDKGFYRIAKCDTSNQNMSLIYDYNSIQTYLSIGNGEIYNFSCNLEDNCYSTTKCINGMDRRTKIMTFLGTKYYICSEKDARYIPYGYTLYKKIKDARIYINEKYLSAGVFYDSYILETEYQKLSPLEKEDALITTAVIEESIDYVKKEDSITDKIINVINLNYDIKNQEEISNIIKIKNKNQTISLKLEDIKPYMELYLSIKNLEYHLGTNRTDFKISTSFNGMKDSEQVQDYASSAYYIKNPNFLINLGTTTGKDSDELKITFNNKGTYTFDSLEILAVPMESYAEKIDKLRENEMTNIAYGNDFLSGTLKTNTNGILQMTTSYSDGWKAYIDGKETKIIKVNDGFVGIPVEAGNHKIEFRYTTPYINLGIILSAIGLVGFISIFILKKRKAVDN